MMPIEKPPMDHCDESLTARSVEKMDSVRCSCMRVARDRAVCAGALVDGKPVHHAAPDGGGSKGELPAARRPADEGGVCDALAAKGYALCPPSSST